MEVYARRNAENPLLMHTKRGGKKKSDPQPALTCARMEHSWGCDCSGCSSCNAADDRTFKTGDSSERGSRVPPPRLGKDHAPSSGGGGGSSITTKKKTKKNGTDNAAVAWTAALAAVAAAVWAGH
jgi:hypothetical protein